MDLTVEKIWRRYNQGTGYLENNGVFENVKRNENFYDGRQWSDQLNGSSMPTPVFNVLQRSGKFMVATIGTNDVAINMVPFSQIFGKWRLNMICSVWGWLRVIGIIFMSLYLSIKVITFCFAY